MSPPGSAGPAAGPGSRRGLPRAANPGNSVWAREWTQGPRRERQRTSDKEPEIQLGLARGVKGRTSN